MIVIFLAIQYSLYNIKAILSYGHHSESQIVNNNRFIQPPSTDFCVAIK